MAEIIKKINKLSHPAGLNLLINISLILICIQLSMNTTEMSNSFLAFAYIFVASCFYYFNKDANLE